MVIAAASNAMNVTAFFLHKCPAYRKQLRSFADLIVFFCRNRHRSLLLNDFLTVLDYSTMQGQSQLFLHSKNALRFNRKDIKSDRLDEKLDFSVII